MSLYNEGVHFENISSLKPGEFENCKFENCDFNEIDMSECIFY